MAQDTELLSWWPEYHRLVTAWSQTREAGGGISAMAGFAFQLTLSLLDMIRAEAQEGPERVFVESLSDSVRTSGCSIVVTQAKLSLRSDALSSALKELWSIHLLAMSVSPGLIGKLSYRILASRRFLVDVERAVERWRPTSSVADIDVLDLFKTKLAVHIEPDPSLELARYLVNAFGHDKPFAKINEWVGALLAAAGVDQLEHTARVVATDISALSAAARMVEGKFYLWQVKDRPPSVVRRAAPDEKATLVGELPDVSDLRQGRFASRPIFYVVHSEIEEWLAKQETRDSSILPAYWISGRSGTGKSIALLHAIADVHAANQDRVIIWLRGRSDRLAEAVRWARPFLKDGYQVILAVDDPYPTQRQAGFSNLIDDVLTEIASVREEAPSVHLPLLICCGPSEQREDFIEDLADVVDVATLDLPHEAAGEVEALRRWYKARTGRADLPVGETSGTLMVQLFFEWKAGQSLEAFARRFRRRLLDALDDEEQLFDLMAEILALNRLYALYPLSALQKVFANSPKLESAYRRLADDEGHLTLVAPADGPTSAEGSGVRLTHPHLADAIYSVWFARDKVDGPYRRQHLRRAILAALDSVANPSARFAPLWSIIRLARHPDPQQGVTRLKLIDNELKQVLPELYRDYHPRITNSLTDLPVWVDLDCRFALGLVPPPISELASAVSAADNHGQGLRLACHKLLEFGQTTYQQVIEALLIRLPDWQEWEPVALDFLRRSNPARIAEALALHLSHRFATLGAERLVHFLLYRRQDAGEETRLAATSWLSAAPSTHASWPWYYLGFARKFPIPDELVDRGFQFLKESPAASGFGFVWIALWKASEQWHEELNSIGREWLERSMGGQTSWSYVWEALWLNTSRQDADLAEIGRAWLEQTPPHNPSWSFVWEALRKSDDPDPALDRMGQDWLIRTSANDPSWAFVWTALWEASGSQNVQLECTGREWLERTSPEHQSWSFVWERLWEKFDKQDTELDGIGRSWLERTWSKGHPSWTYVWVPLWEASGRRDTELDSIGRAWLERASPEHRSWSFVWVPLWEAAGKQDAELGSIARKWLEYAPPEHKSWKEVWEQLWMASGNQDAELRHIGQKWLERAPVEHGSWAFVWAALWKASGKQDAELGSIGRRWLEGAPVEHGSWKEVWEQLWKASGKQDAEFGSIAKKWLGCAPPEHRSWKEVWEQLWKASGKQDAELGSIARKWLECAPPEHKSWKEVWEQLWMASGNQDAELRHIGQKWLERAPSNHGSWAFVWAALWETSGKQDAELGCIGREWLERAPVEHGSWAFVWAALWKASGKQDAELGSIGRRWLEGAPVEHGSWTYVWRPLWEASDKQDVQLSRLGLGWLESAPPSQRSWTHVWRSLWEASDKQDAELRRLARGWLESAPPDHPAWTLIWGHLWEASSRQDPELYRMGRNWLKNAPVGHRGRSFIHATTKKKVRESALAPQAKMQVLIHYPSWWANSISLLPRSKQQDYIPAALRWLREHPPETDGWFLIWKRLWELELQPQRKLAEVFSAEVPEDLSSAEAMACRATIAEWKKSAASG